MTLNELINLPEDEHCEFKEASSRFDFEELVKYACALANCGGGRVVLGVSDKRPRKVVGTRAFEQPERTRNGLIERLHIGVSFEVLEAEGKRVLVFEVKGRPMGMAVSDGEGNYWGRRGDMLVRLSTEDLKRIFLEGEGDYSAEICAGAAIRDLDREAIRRFRGRWASKTGRERIKALSDEQLLKDCGLLDERGLTVAALVLFGTRRALRRYVGTAEVIYEYRVNHASGPARFRREFQEGFFCFVDELTELVRQRTDMLHYREGLFIFDIPTVNEAVLREALLNAVCHRSYRMPGSVFVRHYPESLTVESPGGFPSGVTLENVLVQQVPRNRLLAVAFARCGLVERAGQGMNLIFEQSIREAKGLPSFDGTDAYLVRLTLNCTMTSQDVLTVLEEIGEETLAQFSTEAFIFIDHLARGETVPGGLAKEARRLMALGIIEKGRNGGYVLSRRLAHALGKDALRTRQNGLDADTNKALLLEHIRDQGADGAPFRDLKQVLSYLPERRVRVLLDQLQKEGRCVPSGHGRGARWYVVRKNGENEAVSSGKRQE